MTKIQGGGVNHNYIQLAYQLSNSVLGFVYSFVVTYFILFLMRLIPGLSLRVTEEAEIKGIDETEIGHYAYDFTIRRDVELDHTIPYQ